MEVSTPGKWPSEYKAEHIKTLIYIDFTTFVIQVFELINSILQSYTFVNKHACNKIE